MPFTLRRQESRARSTSYSSRISEVVTPEWSHHWSFQIIPYFKSKLQRFEENVRIKSGLGDKKEILKQRQERIATEEQKKALNTYHKSRLDEQRKRDERLNWFAKKDAKAGRKANKAWRKRVRAYEQATKEAQEKDRKELMALHRKYGHCGWKLRIQHKIMEWTPGVKTG